MRKDFISAFFFLIFVLSFRSFLYADEPVVLTTSDGYQIHGTYLPHQNARASILLIHMLGRNRSDWKDFANFLERSGYKSLAIDLRGHGESQSEKGGKKNWKDLSKRDFKRMVEDVDSAYRFLKEKGENKPIFIIGASIGANLALIYTSQHPEVSGAILLSPGLTYHDIKIARYASQYKARPLLLVVAQDDEYSLMSTRYLMDLVKTEDKMLKEYPTGAGHGTQIFDFKPAHPKEIALKLFLLDWLEKKSSLKSKK